MGEGHDKGDASCSGTGAGVAPDSRRRVIVVMGMALVMAPKKKG